MENTTKYIIEVRRSAEQKQAKFFQSAPDRHGYRIRKVSSPALAKQFQTEIEASEACDYLSAHYALNFTVVEKVA